MTRMELIRRRRQLHRRIRQAVAERRLVLALGPPTGAAPPEEEPSVVSV